jgi:hypothetical protein
MASFVDPLVPHGTLTRGNLFDVFHSEGELVSVGVVDQKVELGMVVVEDVEVASEVNLLR